MDSIIFMIVLQVALIALNAVFACAEIAVISMNDTKLERMAEEGDKRAGRLVKLTSQPARFLATIQVAITLSGFLGSAFAAENFSGVLVDWLIGLGVPVSAKVLDSIAVVFITLVLSYFTLVFGELVPKQVAMRKAEVLALGISGLISGIAKVFAPIVSFLTFSTNGILRLMGIDPNAVDEEVGEEEIRMMVDAGSEKGTIDHQEREFIQNVFEFDDLCAEDLVTQRMDVTMLDMEDSMGQWKEIIFNTRHTLYPICDGSVDNIVGVLNAKEYFRLEDKSREKIMEKAVRPAYFVPNMIKADALFRNMKKERQPMAIVLNEYGGVIGIVTIHDLVEQLVGDLMCEEEEEEALIQQVSEDTWDIRGAALLEDVSKAIGVILSCDEYDTFNGLIFHTLESVPEEDEETELEIGRIHIKVMEIKNHQVEMARVTLKENKEQ